jgi:hypothetical protein
VTIFSIARLLENSLPRCFHGVHRGEALSMENAAASGYKGKRAVMMASSNDQTGPSCRGQFAS